MFLTMLLQGLVLIGFYFVVVCSFETVINPETKRAIKVEGPTFSALLQSGYVYHDKILHLIRPGHYLEPISSTEWIKADPLWSDFEQGENCDDDSGSVEILFINKPSGLLTVPGREQPDCLIQRVSEEYPTAKICHRLDRDTSGVMVIALNPAIHALISKQFETRQTSKVYTALVAGHLDKEEGIINLPIGKACTMEGYNRWVIGGTNPRDATTQWQVLERLQCNDFAYTRVRVQPLTGRGQQIRLHMQAIGHALLGDTLHAPQPIATATPRLCLHATRLGFTVNGKYVEATVPPPF